MNAILLSMALALFVFAFTACGGGAIEETPPPEPDTVLEQEEIHGYDFSSDAAFLVEMVEAVHPIFIIRDMLPDYYEAFRDEFLATSSELISRTEFVLAIKRYFTALHDGHMGGGWFTDLSQGEPQAFRDGWFIDTRFVVREGRLFLYEYPDIEIIEIGGVPVGDIFYQIDRYYFSENESARMWNYAVHSRYELILRRAGAEIRSSEAGPYVYMMTLEDGEQFNRMVSMSADITGLWPDFDDIISHEMIGNIFYIDLRIFVDGDHITEVADEIEAAIESGVYRFIVDLRGNPGGNDWAGQRLLMAMGITVPAHGVTTRISDLAREQRGYTGHYISQRTDSQPLTVIANNPNNVRIAVMTDRLSFSSATGFSVWVADGGFGYIIGEPSSNAPTSFGDMLPLTLPTAEIMLSISHRLFLRPNRHADQQTLWPDIYVPSRDALEVALEWLSD